MKNILISMETSKSKDLKKTDLTILLMNARIAFRKWFTLRRQYCFPTKSQTDISTQKLSLTRVRKKVPLDNIAQRAESYKPKERVTYKMIKEYIEAKYGFKVHTAYIAEVKRDLGLPMYDAPNAVEELKQPKKASDSREDWSNKGSILK